MPVTIRHSGAIAHVIVDNPPVNAISAAVREGLVGAARTLARDPSVRGVVLSCTGRTFIAGADIRELGQTPVPPHLPDVVAAIEDCAKPWVAAIHGSALGGGLEIALGCRWRVADTAAQLGLPEVNLGLIPGAGGTVRLPRLIGAADATAMVTSGKPVSAAQALKTGLIEAIIDGETAAAAEAWLLNALDQPWPQPLWSRCSTVPDGAFWDERRAALTRATRGNPAILEALDSVRFALEHDFCEAMDHERAVSLRLREQPESAALRHVFMAERAAPRPAELRGVEPHRINRAGVVGGGTMGAGIAMAMLGAGIAVRMVERDNEAAARGQANVEKLIADAQSRGRLTEAKADALRQSFSVSTGYADLGDCDLVIEAVFEELGIKQQVFAELARVTPPETILATNTSYLDPREIFAGLPGQARFIGLHFFSPAHVMKLLEIVPTPDTSDATLATGFDLARRMAKIPARAGICDGFIGNRLLKLMRAQTERILLTGATPAQVDAAIRGFGFAMGPFEVQDMGGLDIAAFQRQAARARGEQAFGPIADRLATSGRLGRKTGAGWYDYDTSGKMRTTLPDAVQEAITAARIETGTEPRIWSPDEITEAILLPMIDEAAQIVAEGIALRDADVDLVEVHGYGFPRYRGGPLHYGQALGFDTVAARLQHLAERGISAAPSPALLARANMATA